MSGASVFDALQPGERVLDTGSGPGLVAEMAEVVGQSGRVTGLEVSDSMLALGRRRCADPSFRERVAFVKADAAALPFPDGTFDLAVSTQVYEYVADLKAAFAELHRVLRPGGRALVNATAPDRLDEALCRPPPPARSPGNSRMPDCRFDAATSWCCSTRSTTLIPSAWPTARSWPTSPSPNTR
jgi:ubiquinone/menaquinone biosynthesis C-methylase UbiE